MKPVKLACACLLIVLCGNAFAADQQWQAESLFRPWRKWSQSIEQLKTGDHEQVLACLGTSLEMTEGQWPLLRRRRIPWHSSKVHSDMGLDFSLGQIAIGSGEPQSYEVQRVDFSGSKVVFSAPAQEQLEIWMSRTTPAVVLRSNAQKLRLFAGKESPKPKFFACEIDGEVVSGPVDEFEEYSSKFKAGSWLLVWFDDLFQSARFSIYIPMPYPADCPMLVFFGNAPQSVSLTDGLRAEYGVDGEVGGAAVLPLFGDNYPAADFDKNILKRDVPEHGYGGFTATGELHHYGAPENFSTADWDQELPSTVADRCRWWSKYLCEVPVSATESYSYDPSGDTVTVTEEFDYVRLSEGGSPFAPLPPMLALAKVQGFDMEINGAAVRSGVLTSHGYYAGVEGARGYTWQVSGLDKYLKQRPDDIAVGAEPEELSAELAAEVDNILQAGVLGPWYPVLMNFGAGYKNYYRRGYEGHYLWANPAETLYYLAEAYPVLDEERREKVLSYLKELRTEYPPEELHLLRMGEGARRTHYTGPGPNIINRLNERFEQRNPYLQLGIAPAKNLYFLSRYYGLKGISSPCGAEWEKMREVLEPYLKNLDWGTMGFYRRPIRWFKRNGVGGVIDMNDWYAALVGGVRLAKQAGDTEAETMLRGLFAKAAAMQFAMGKYTDYLYEEGLLRSPAEEDWMFTLLAGSWKGHLYTAHWSGPDDEVATIWEMDQFGCYVHESRLDTRFGECPGILRCFEPTVELVQFWADNLKQEAQALLRRVNEAMPAWWTMYCPAVQSFETNIQPPEDSYQLFLLKKYVLQAKAEELAWKRDVPWLKRGDLYYLHKLAETIKSYNSGN